MIQSLIDSWSLFGDTYVAALAMAVLLAVVGIPVVARDQIFLGAAVTQMALFGVAVGYLVHDMEAVYHTEWISRTMVISLFSVGFAVATAVFTMCMRSSKHTPEALTGWLFLVATSATYVVLAKSPYGMKEVTERVSSSVIGASRADSVMFVVGAIVVLVVAHYFFKTLMLVTLDRQMAIASGLPVARIELAIALVTGIALGMGLRAGGMLFTFGCLVLPTLIARQFCREIRRVLWVAPAIALAVSALAFTIGNHWDIPQAALSVVLMAVLLLPASLVRRG